MILRGAIAVLLALGTVGPQPVRAEPAPPVACQPTPAAKVATTEQLAACSGRILTALELHPGAAIAPAALARQLAHRPGLRFDARRWEADLQRLFNLGFFRRLATRVLAVDEPEGLQLELTVEKTWSILPILGYQGGPLTIAILGAYDANFLGQLAELGGYYLRRDEFNLVRGWLVLPNAPGYGHQLELQLFMAAHLVALYPGDRAGPLPEEFRRSYSADQLPWLIPDRGIEVLRRGVFLEYGHNLWPGLVAVALRYLLLWESTAELTNLREVQHAQLQGASGPSFSRQPLRRTRLSLPDFNLRLGQIDYLDNYHYRGHELRFLFVPSVTWLGSEQSFCWFYLTGRSFTPLRPWLELALQATVAHSTSTDPIYQFSLGGDNLDPLMAGQKFPGLLTVRGFPSSLLHGPTIAFGNLELRATLQDALPLWFLGRGALQLAAFLDVGQVRGGSAASPHPDATRLTTPALLSAGGGLLFSFRDIRFAYLNWYVAHGFLPLPTNELTILLTRPFF